MFAQKLKRLREKKGFSQQSLAERAGINKMLISKYETGRSAPTMDNLGKIAKALEVTADYLVFDNVPSNGRVEFKDLELLEKFKEAENLSEKDRQTIKTLVDAMIVKRKVEGVVKLHP
ncbi:MAG: helix-turn-helix transcriptional regulator [Thermodesulfobacteriota bacterium]|nr:helix-turn-helix transcriptional regulator [Thermodesulfobacteriota bacterium]